MFEAIMELFFVWVWFGGIYPAYVLERADGNNKFWSSLSALTWPVGLGKVISFHYFATEKGNNSKDLLEKINKETTNE